MIIQIWQRRPILKRKTYNVTFRGPSWNFIRTRGLSEHVTLSESLITKLTLVSQSQRSCHLFAHQKTQWFKNRDFASKMAAILYLVYGMDRYTLYSFCTGFLDPKHIWLATKYTCVVCQEGEILHKFLENCIVLTLLGHFLRGVASLIK